MKKWKIDNQDGSHGGHLGFPIRTTLVIFELQVTPMIPTSFKSIGLLVQEKKRKLDFQDGHHRTSWISNQKDFSFFDLQVTLMLPSKFQVNWPFGSGEEVNKRPMGHNSLTCIFTNAMQQSSSIATATGTQIWPYHKKVKGHPSFIILTNLVDLSP